MKNLLLASFGALLILTLTACVSGSPTPVETPGSERFHGVMQNETIGQVLWEVFIPTERPGQ